MDYGIKVMKVGYSVTDTDIRNIILSSKYNMLKYHSDNVATLNITNGSSSGSVNVSHDLGFVPAFITYLKSSAINNRDYLLPYPGGIYLGIDYSIKVDSYATSSNITVRVNNSGEFGTYNQTATDYYNDLFDTNSGIEVGNEGGAKAGAMRFTNVDIDSSTALTSAEVFYYVGLKGAGAGSLGYNIVGIDEDNTAAFSGSPMGRPSTSANYNYNRSITQGQFFGSSVPDIVSEIVNRAGWASGNAMGFKFTNNGSPADVWAWDSSFQSYMRIVKSGSTSFNFRVIIFKDRIDF